MMSRDCANARNRSGSRSSDPDRSPAPVTAPTQSPRAAAPSPAESDLTYAARIASLGVLTASISHEVKQPLAAIIIDGHTCLRRLTSLDPDIEKARELTRRMVVYAQRAADIINRIHAMAARRVPRQAPLSLDDVVKASMSLLRNEFQLNGVSVSLDLAPALPLVIGDSIQLEQVVVNLAINAVQAVTRAGTRRAILIRTTLSDSETVCCTIEDSGPGLAPENVPFLFDFTTKGTGIGMGLPISRSIIEAHGGRIRADNKSALGGARFVFALPVNRSSEN